MPLFSGLGFVGTGSREGRADFRLVAGFDAFDGGPGAVLGATAIVRHTFDDDLSTGTFTRIELTFVGTKILGGLLGGGIGVGRGRRADGGGDSEESEGGAVDLEHLEGALVTTKIDGGWYGSISRVVR